MKSILIILLLLSTLLQAKSKSDSLLGVWHNNSNNKSIRTEALNNYLEREIPQMINKKLEQLTDSFEIMAKNSEKPKLISQSYFHKAKLKQLKNDYLGSTDFYNKAIDMSLANRDTLGLSDGYTGLGRNYHFMGNFEQANKYYFKTLDLLKLYSNKKDIKSRVVTVSNNIGSIYFRLNQFAKSIEHYTQALQGYKELNDLAGIAAGYINVGACYISLENYDNALLYFDSSLVLIEKEKIKPLFKANALSNIGAVLIFKKDTAAGIAKTKEAIEIYKSIGSHYNHAISLNQIAAVQFGSTSIETALLALKISKEIKADNLQLEIIKLLYTKYKEVGKTDSALAMLEQRNILEEQINESESLLQLSEYEKEMQIDSLEDTNAGNIDALKNKNILTVILIVGIALILILLLLGIIKFRTIKQNKEKSHLLSEIKGLKEQFSINKNAGELMSTESIPLDKTKLETLISGKLNETDWSVLNALIENPVLSNKDIANKVHKSVDGIRSSLKKMYSLFEIPSSQNMRLSLVLKTIHLSNNNS